MKIAMVFPVFDKGGGIQRALVELTLQLLSDGHDVHLVANSRPRAYRDIPFHHVPMLKPNNPLQMTSFCLTSTLALRGLQASERFDIVHCHGAATLRADVITAQSCHRTWVESSGPTLRPLSKAWFRRLINPQHPAILAIERYQYGRAHYGRIAAVSNGVKQDIMHLYQVPENDIRVIPNGVNFADFAGKLESSERGATRNTLGFAEHDHVLLFVANELPRKGFSYLVDALSFLPTNVHVLCIGRANPAPYRSVIAEKGLFHRIHFISHDVDLRRYYAASDIFVFPTQYEAFGMVLLEAAAAGLPIVCTKTDGPADVFTDGVDALFVERDAQDIAKRVEWVLDNQGDARLVGAAARETAKKYQWERIKDAYIEVYEDVLEMRQIAGAAVKSRFSIRPD